MKILIIRPIPNYMAVVRNTYNIQEVGLAKALIRAGHSCDILFWTDKEEKQVTIPVDDIGKIIVFYRRGLSALKNCVFTDCTALFEQYDVIQCAEYNQMQSWLLAKKYPKKTVIYHGPYYSAFNRRYNLMCKVFDTFFLRRYLRLGTRFIVKSPLAKEFLMDKGIKEENIHVAGVGLDLQMLSTRQEATADGSRNMESSDTGTEIIRKIRQDSSPLKMVYVGRIEERRNPLFLLETLEKVRQRTGEGVLYLVGDGDDTWVDAMTDAIDQKGLTEYVIWQKKIEQKYLSDLYKEASVFLLPTHYEIFGMVLLEAMAFGVPTITTINGGSRMLIDHGMNGFAFKEIDADEWADTVEKLYRDKDKRESIGNAAKETIEKQYTWDRLIERFMKAYSG